MNAVINRKPADFHVADIAQADGAGANRDCRARMPGLMSVAPVRADEPLAEAQDRGSLPMTIQLR